ncbi:LPS sulfotransferase NodH [Pseudorhodobacter antarcticus]|uniref:LPS sulfotransferase NodH n=1 Tax=Pseudorhodobacter antarcticus TaxID=1077947 RepID=A0A1H8GLN7_9RHOB|nr:sulfotransferase [Pseudorhodobacter antarcticus]SEN45071.1 LPS sulfotransferase NodH [Pseudorhodobacter antarcticus]
MPLRSFVIIGQARSGTTYLQTMLDSHPHIHCRGELFDPWQIDDAGRKTKDFDAIVARDANPCDFMDRMLAGEGMQRAAKGVQVIGAKILFQHSPDLMAQYIPMRPALRIIHVVRHNKLAQFASSAQVAKTKVWTATSQPAPAPLINAAPQWVSAECNRLQNQDFLLTHWLGSIANPVLTLTYQDLFRDAALQAALDFLGVTATQKLNSALIKQGQRRIMDRFANPGPIAAYFATTGRADWLEDELAGGS